MPEAKDIVERYLASFNETDGQARQDLLESLYAGDSTYTDPLVDLTGPREIDAFIATTQDQFPGFAFSLAGPIDAHHNQMRFQWKVGPTDADPMVIGFDVIVMRNEKIESVHGFHDVVPAA